MRIEFFGDEIDSIRLFDVDSQRSIETLESQSVFPVAVKGSKNSSVLSYLDHGIVFYDEPQRGEESLKQFFKEEKANAGKAFLWSELIHTARKQTNQEIVFSLLKRELEEFKPSGIPQLERAGDDELSEADSHFYGRFEIPSE